MRKIIAFAGVKNFQSEEQYTTQRLPVGIKLLFLQLIGANRSADSA
jgi:hypothetical protein